MAFLKRQEKYQINNLTLHLKESEKEVQKKPKAVLRGKFIAIQAYLGKQEKCQINNITLHLKKLEDRKSVV